jgi:hypothetical protein
MTHPFPTAKAQGVPHNWISVKAASGAGIGLRCIACKLSVYEGEKLVGPPFAPHEPCPGLPLRFGSFPPNYMPVNCHVEKWPPDWHKES